MEQLLIALDVETADRAHGLADQLRGTVGGFKIGSQLFTAEGPSVVETLVARGDRVFLDLKFHDIPNTVAGAVRAASRLGIWMLTVHVSGGLEMMQAAKEAARSTDASPLVVGITVLTSLDHDALSGLGVTHALPEHVVELARLAQRAGVDGVVASTREAGMIRQRCGPSLTIVTPGIRGGASIVRQATRADDVTDDQTRTGSAAHAVRAGADYIVVGRPVIDAPDPRVVAEQIAQELTHTH